MKPRIALIGCGTWGMNFARVLVNQNDCIFVAVADLNPIALKRLDTLSKDVITYSDYNLILQNNDIDAVIISTPVSTHFEIAKASILAGKHIMCEKPLTLKNEESIALKDLAYKYNVILMVGHIFLYNDGIHYIKEAIDNKTLGNPLYMYFKRTGLGPVREDVDAIWDLAPHDISIANYLLNSMPISVTAFGNSYIKPGRVDVAFLMLEYQNNVFINIHVSWIDPTKQRQITIVGDKKMLVFDDVTITDKIRIYDKGVSYQTQSGDFGEFQLAIRDGEIVIPNIKQNEPLKSEVAHFIECIIKGKKPFTDGENAVSIMTVLEAAKKSIKNNNTKIYL